MQLKNLLTDDDAVSPVIGVILMVAITVILAAVIAAFVLGLGESDEVGPQVSFDWDYTEGDQNLTITHQSGDSFTASTVDFAGFNVSGFEGAENWADEGALEEAPLEPDDTVDAGDRITGSVDYADFELDVIWTSTDGEDSNIIGSRTGPDA